MRTFTVMHPRASGIRCCLTGLCLIVVLAGLSTQLFAQVSVTISPSVVTLATSATQSFTATVNG
jgi:alpha-D-ribose 1-methylphosphonate 5-triphosphate synthase subunit PhnG